MTVVTPFAGVWVEIRVQHRENNTHLVTPLAGVWIEMLSSPRSVVPG